MYKCETTKEEYSNYKEYLKTDHWKEIKNKMFKSKYKYECYCCNKKYDLQLHHKTYKRIGKERLNDLIWLCYKCHKKTHDLNNNGINLWKSARLNRKKFTAKNSAVK